MRNGTEAVTADHIRDAWRKVNGTLPNREVARALRSLTGREVLAGSQAYSFTVDLQRLWLDKHRRLDWVKDELAETVQEWNQSTEPSPGDTIPHLADEPGPASITKAIPGHLHKAGRVSTHATPRATSHGRRLAIAAALAILVITSLAVTAVTHVFPFSTPKQNLAQLLPGGISEDEKEWGSTAPSTDLWSMPGLVQALHCTDPRLKDGNVYAYQLASAADFRTAWQNFNQWWGFRAGDAGNECPPTGESKGIITFGASDLANNAPVTECGRLTLSPGHATPAYAWTFPTNDAFVIAQGAPDATFSALVSWLNHHPAQSTLPTPAPAPISFTFTEASQYPCSAEGTIHSVNGGTPVSFSFINYTSESLQIIWLDDSGSRVAQDTLPPGETYRANIRTIEAWMIADSSANCERYFRHQWKRSGIGKRITCFLLDNVKIFWCLPPEIAVLKST
jgi:hypothetical protein